MAQTNMKAVARIPARVTLGSRDAGGAAAAAPGEVTGYQRRPSGAHTRNARCPAKTGRYASTASCELGAE